MTKEKMITLIVLYRMHNQKRYTQFHLDQFLMNMNWIKVDTVKNIIYQYANKNTRDLEKLNSYLPLALEILDEFDLYLKNNDKDKTALSKYKELRKSVSYANKYAVVQRFKKIHKFQV